MLASQVIKFRLERQKFRLGRKFFGWGGRQIATPNSMSMLPLIYKLMKLDRRSKRLWQSFDSLTSSTLRIVSAVMQSLFIEYNRVSLDSSSWTSLAQAHTGVKTAHHGTFFTSSAQWSKLLYLKPTVLTAELRRRENQGKHERTKTKEEMMSRHVQIFLI